MEALISPRGLIADLITPLKPDGSIDGKGLERILDRVAPFAQAVFLSSPHTGEGKNLSSDQRSELLEKALAVISGRIPILIWITRDTEDDTSNTILDLKKVLAGKKEDSLVFLVDTPLFYHSNRGLPAYYKNICSMVDHPFILHNDPELIRGLDRPFKRNNIRTGILKELIAIDNIAGLIFLGPLDRAYNYQKACRRRTHFRIYDGDETSFLAHPSTSGVVSTGATLAPGAWQRMVQSSLQLTGEGDEGHLRQIWKLDQYLRNLKDAYQKMPAAVIKEVLSDNGIIETPASTFPAEDTEKQKEQIKELMAIFGD